MIIVSGCTLDFLVIWIGKYQVALGGTIEIRNTARKFILIPIGPDNYCI